MKENIELKKKRELLKYSESLERILFFFDSFEENKKQIISTIDDYDLDKNDTCLKLTKELRSNLTFIKLKCRSASYALSQYRKLGNSNYRTNLEIAIQNLKKCKDNVEEMRKHERKSELKLEKLKAKLDSTAQTKEEGATKRTTRIDNIELNIIRLKWAFFFIFAIQIAICILLSK